MRLLLTAKSVSAAISDYTNKVDAVAARDIVEKKLFIRAGVSAISLFIVFALALGPLASVVQGLKMETIFFAIFLVMATATIIWASRFVVENISNLKDLK